MAENLNQYKTRQRTAILEYIEQNKDKHITANDILINCAEIEKVSQTTIYRYLDKLVKEGKIKKYYYEEKSASCYQYVGEACNNHYHLKCEKCGELIHIDNDVFLELEKSISSKYKFNIDNVKTILYGICSKCK